MRNKKVLVLGAGVSGLTVAYELLPAGADRTVIEAQVHPGRRVLSRQALNAGWCARADQRWPSRSRWEGAPPHACEAAGGDQEGCRAEELFLLTRPVSGTAP